MENPPYQAWGATLFRWISQCFPWAASRLDTPRAIVPQRPQVRLAAAEDLQLRSDDGHGHSLIQVCRLKYYIYAMMYIHDTSDICNYIYMYIYIYVYVYICICICTISKMYIYIIYIQLSMYLSIYSVHSCSIHPKKQTYGLPSGLDEHPPYTEHDFKKNYLLSWMFWL
jgi:hypothetical protein